MRLVAFMAMSSVCVRKSWRNRGQALWMSAAAVALLGLYRATAAVLVDAGGNFVDDLLNTWVGRIGEWLILAGVMTAHVVHVCRHHKTESPAKLPRSQRHALEFTQRSTWLQRRAALRAPDARWNCSRMHHARVYGIRPKTSR